MKKIVIGCIMVLPILGLGKAHAQWPWKRIEGNGMVKKESRNVGHFTSVSSSGPWDVMIADGTPGEIQVEGDANLLEEMQTMVEGDKLIIRSKNHVSFKTKNKLTVYITMDKISGLSVSGSGDVIGEGNFVNDGESVFRISGSGNIRLQFRKTGSVNIDVSGSGNVQLEGNTGVMQAHISGSGNIKCEHLYASEVTAGVSGSGNIRVFASKRLNARVSGSGNIYYSGGAPEVQKHTSGSGKVIRQDTSK